MVFFIRATHGKEAARREVERQRRRWSDKMRRDKQPGQTKGEREADDPATAKQAETTAYENVRSNPFTRVHGRPTRSDYEILKSEASALASEVEDITYSWSKNATDKYGLLGDILGADEYDELTSIDTYAVPNEPASYDPTITNATLTHERKRNSTGLAELWGGWPIELRTVSLYRGNEFAILRVFESQKSPFTTKIAR